MTDPSTFYEGSMRTDAGARIDKLIADPTKLHFLGEQDGPAERELNRRLIEVLAQHKTVDFAYLATIQYSDEDTWAVALCLRFSSADAIEQTVRAAGDVFNKMFDSSQRLDIIAVSDEQWPELRTICKPFYTRNPV